MTDNRTYKVIIWGMGRIYREQLHMIRQMENEGTISVIAVTDSNKDRSSLAEGHTFLSPDEISLVKHDLLFMMAWNSRDEILSRYLKMPDADRNKVIDLSILARTGLTLHEYVQIVRLRPTIFSIFCWGGYLYNSLGMECISPFKNLWLHSDDYLRLLENPEYYMSLDPELDHMKKALSPEDEPVYPVLKIDDVRLYCNHDSDPEKAINDWNRRRAKINWDFTVAMYHTNMHEREDRFARISKFDRKICFVPYKPRYPFSFYIPADSKNSFYQKVNRTVLKGGEDLDIYSIFFGALKHRGGLEGTVND